MKALVYNMFADTHRDAAIATLRDLERKLPSQEARFAVPFTYRGKGHFKSMRMQQAPQEIEQLYRMVCDWRPSVVVEIGTAKGGSLYLWTQAAADDATIVSIDMPSVGFGGYAPCRAPFYESFARGEQNVHLLRADSHAAETLEQLKSILDGQPIDFLFIDGDHTYDGVKADFESYSQLVRSGGHVVLHDVLPNTETPRIQVDRYWSELRGQYETNEIVADETAPRRIGIGVVRINATPPTSP